MTPRIQFKRLLCMLGPSMLLGWFLTGCPPKGPDPFEIYGRALNEVRASDLPDAWPPEAVLVLGDSMIQTAFARAADLMLAELPDHLEVSFMAATIRLEPRIHRTVARLEATDTCDSCLLATIEIRGDTVLEISNPTGRMTRSLPWTGTLKAVYHLHIVQEVRGDVSIVAAPAEEDVWDVDLRFDRLDPAHQGLIAEPVREQLRRIVASGKRFSFQLARLEDDSVLAIRALRVRPVPAGIALDQAYVVVNPAHVEGDLPDPDDGWVAVVPAGTLLALVKAAMYQAPQPEDARIEPVTLELKQDRFVMDLRIYPNRWPRKPILIRASGTVGITPQNTLGLLSLDAVPVKERFSNPAKLLVRARLKDRIENALAASVPVSAEKDMGPGAARVVISSVACDQGQMIIRGNMEVVQGSTNAPHRGAVQPDPPPAEEVSP